MRKEIKIIRRWMVFFMAALFVSGITAMPVERELAFLTSFFRNDTPIDNWLEKAHTGVAHTNLHFPFIGYGYDWLAFAHFMLAVLFIGPYKDPVRNKWIVEFGMIACFMVIPFALTAGHFREIPLWWRIIDCSFGIAGLVPLGICLRKIIDLEEQNKLSLKYSNTFHQIVS
jgi:hypothetical protein